MPTNDSSLVLCLDKARLDQRLLTRRPARRRCCQERLRDVCLTWSKHTIGHATVSLTLSSRRRKKQPSSEGSEGREMLVDRVEEIERRIGRREIIGDPFSSRLFTPTRVRTVVVVPATVDRLGPVRTTETRARVLPKCTRFLMPSLPIYLATP